MDEVGRIVRSDTRDADVADQLHLFQDLGPLNTNLFFIPATTYPIHVL